ncbi:MAG: high-potential iron-sulfur protein [Acidobacteriota bacterium]|nr:high-potential iron-sulfur protein [Acidobacteriota bacterium]
MTHDVSRRAFLRSLFHGAVVLGPAAALLACDGASDRARIAEIAKGYDRALHCSGTTGLWPAEIETRTDNEYVDRSIHEDQFCFNCTNFIKPSQPGSCGTCKNVKGSINPLGWCKTWTEARI